jgi:hypothetical protein
MSQGNDSSGGQPNIDFNSIMSLAMICETKMLQQRTEDRLKEVKAKQMKTLHLLGLLEQVYFLCYILKYNVQYIDTLYKL